LKSFPTLPKYKMVNLLPSRLWSVFSTTTMKASTPQGVKHYFAHFAGPVKALAPLMFPIEIVSHLSRIVSLSFRLFGNY